MTGNMASKKVRFSIKKKALLLVMLPILLVIILFLYYIFNQIKTEVSERVEKNYSERIKLYVRLAEAKLLNGANFLDISTKLPGKNFAQLTENQIKQFLTEIVNKEEVIFGAVIGFDRNKYSNKKLFAPYIYRSGDSLKFMDIGEKRDYTTSEHAWFYVPSQIKKSFWTKPYIAPVFGDKKLITYSVPILDRGEFIGVIEVDFDLEFLDDYLKIKLAETQGQFIIIAEDGTYISHPESKKIINENFKYDKDQLFPEIIRDSVFNKIVSNDHGYFDIPDKNGLDKFFFFHSKIDLINWIFLFYEKESLITKYIDEIFFNANILLIILFLLATPPLFFLINKILKPIPLINDFANAISNGNLDEKIEVRTKDEFGVLSINLQIMGNTIKQREQELKQINEQLEERVIQRTEELNVAKENLDLALKSAQMGSWKYFISERRIEGDDNAKKLYGIDDEQFTGLVEQWMKFIHPNDVLLLNETMMQTLKNQNENYRASFRVLKASGEISYIMSTGKFSYDSLGRPNEAFGVVWDISEIKKAEQQLKQVNDEIKERNKYITDSIVYAKRIQDAILPENDYIKYLLSDYYLIFKPKDVVSGDFYWINKTHNKIIVALVDCTGHGVPGALMSMIGNTLLNEIIILQGLTNPPEILNKLDSRLIEELNKTSRSGTKDGLDIALCVFDLDTSILYFSGAYRPLFFIQNGLLSEIKGDRKSIGDDSKPNFNFSVHSVEIAEETRIFLFSDGIIDQNDSDNKKFGSKRFKELLISTQSDSIFSQGEKVKNAILLHQGDEKQRDDITYFCFELNRSQSILVKEIVLKYEGSFSHQLLLKIGEEVKSRFWEKIPRAAYKQLFFSTLELAQNIGHYSELQEIEDKSTGKGELIVESDDNFIWVSSKNRIENKAKTKLLAKLNYFNSLDKEGLKSVIKDKLRGEEEIDSKGGGIGFMEIIKRTGNPLEYLIEEFDEHQSIITLSAKIKIGEING